MNNLFAFYGSLRMGEYNHKWALKDKPGVEFVGSDTVSGFELRSLGSYPVILPVESEIGIVVDVFKIDNESVANSIRSMELGAGYEEKRVLLPELGETATIYVGGHYHKIHKDSYPLVTNGDWVNRRLQNKAPKQLNEFL